jgi:hypothetical protein
MARQTDAPNASLGSGLGFRGRRFRVGFDRLFQFLAELGQVTRRKLAEKLDDLIPIVIAGEREQIKRGNVEAFGEARNRLRRDRGQAVFDAGKMALRKLAGVCEVGKGHIAFGTEFAKARADFGGIGIRFKSSGHEGRISSRLDEHNEIVMDGRTCCTVLTYPKRLESWGYRAPWRGLVVVETMPNGIEKSIQGGGGGGGRNGP